MIRDYQRKTPDGVRLRVSRTQRRLETNPEAREKHRAAVRRYSKTAHGRIAHQTKKAKRRAQKKVAYVALTREERQRIAALYAEAARRTRETGIPHHVDHDRPLARGGKHHPDNMHVVPADINLAKGAQYASTMEYLLS